MATTLTLDAQDQAILTKRQALLDQPRGPVVGDFVRFADGTERRISHMWDDGAQTSDFNGQHTGSEYCGGTWYLSHGCCSFSGGLYGLTPLDKLTWDGETREGSVWFFSHDHWTAHNGVNATVTLRVYESSEQPPR